MAETERKYAGTLTLKNLEIAIEAHEQLFGEIAKLEAVGNFSVATYDDADYPPAESLVLRPMIGDQAPPPPPGATHVCDGAAVVVSQRMAVAVFRAG